MSRWIIVPVIAVTSLAALVIGLHSLFLDEARGVWLVVKLAGCAVILLGNSTAIIHMRSKAGGHATSIAVTPRRSLKTARGCR